MPIVGFPAAVEALLSTLLVTEKLSSYNFASEPDGTVVILRFEPRDDRPMLAGADHNNKRGTSDLPDEHFESDFTSKLDDEHTSLMSTPEPKSCVCVRSLGSFDQRQTSLSQRRSKSRSPQPTGSSDNSCSSYSQQTDSSTPDSPHSSPYREETRLPSLATPSSIHPLVSSTSPPAPCSLQMAIKGQLAKPPSTGMDSVHDDVLPSLPVAPSMPAATSVWQLTGLPTLSQYVRDQLQTQTGAHKVFKCLINECAQFYLQSGEGPTDRSEYEMIGRRMCAAYPNIAHEGTHPWSHFCQTLSQRIRHVRWSQKRKSDVALSDASTPAQSAPIRKKARFTPSVLPIPVEEHEKHLEELRAEWSKPAPNRLHIQALMRDTFPNRRAWVSSLPDSQFRAILEKYPCLQDGDFIIEDFLRMRNQDEEKMLEQLRSFFDTLMSKCPATSEGTRTAKILAAWSYLEANTAFKKGKGLKTQPVLQMKENISTDNRERETTSAAASPPRLIMFLRDEELTGATIAGDGSRIFLETTSVEKSFLALISTYYVTDLDYPRIYCNVLGMLQQFAVGDPYVGEKSTGYKRFVNILTS